MSINKRGKMLNPHSKTIRLCEYQSLPAIFSLSLQTSGLYLSKFLNSGKKIFYSFSSTLSNFFFPKAQINNILKPKNFFDMIKVEPITSFNPEEKPDEKNELKRCYS